MKALAKGHIGILHGHISTLVKAKEEKAGVGGGGQSGEGRTPAVMSTLKFFHQKKLKAIVGEPDIHKMPKNRPKVF